MSRLAGKGSPQPDRVLLGVCLLLTACGCLMLWSASAIAAEQQTGDSLFYVKRQVLTALAGLALMSWLARSDYNKIREKIKPILALTLMLLVAVLFSPKVAGARRWLRLGPVGIQPSEFAKLGVLLFLADYIDRKNSRMPRFLYGALIPSLAVLLPLGLIALEPDFGTPALTFLVCLIVLSIGGARPKHLLSIALALSPLIVYDVLRHPYRVHRLFAFLDPFKDARGDGYQLSQSLMAVGSGGWLGKGLGASQLKLLYLPAAHTDFIFPILAEELGFAGCAALLALFLLLFVRGVRIARRAPDLFGSLLASGLSLLILLQAYFNVAMSIGLMPTKGLPLPFFSYGRSSLIVTLSAVGMLLSISRQIPERALPGGRSAP